MSKLVHSTVFLTKLTNRTYKDGILLNRIMQIINALLNSEHGGTLQINYDEPYAPTSYIEQLLRSIQQAVNNFIGVATLVHAITIERKSGFLQIIVAPSKIKYLHTLKYNLYLPTEQTVVDVSPKDPVENVRDILRTSKPSPDAVKPGSHLKEFTLGAQVSLNESRVVQFKWWPKERTKCTNLANRLIMNNFERNVSAFANYRGGHMYIGIDNHGIVQGQTIIEDDRTKFKKAINKAINRMIWPENSFTQGEEEKRWQIDFEPVKDRNREIVALTFVVIIYVAHCPGGVFTKCPESYEMYENEAKMVDFTTWKRRIAEECFENEKETSRSWKWDQISINHREKFVKLFEYGEKNLVKVISGVRVSFLGDFLIGKGSEGTRVFIGLGTDGREKAVKRMHKDALASLAEQEAKILNEVSIIGSNNVVKYWFLDHESDEEYLFLMLELCEETLENYVERESLVDLVAAAQSIIRQILTGLADLHSDPIRILHRDLKPANILRNIHGKWLLADFGISRITTKGESTHLTQPGRGTHNWRATESYSSEEIPEDDVRYNAKSDIQVAGMVAYYIVTKGEHPFGGEVDILRNLFDGNPVGLNSVTDETLKDLLSWMLSHDPKDRPTAKQALKHPYLQQAEKNFEMLCSMGNQQEVQNGEMTSNVVQQLNSNLTDWRILIRPDVLQFMCRGYLRGRPHTFSYRSTWTECLRLIRNVNEHWDNTPRPKPQPEAFYVVGNPQDYFLNIFPNLPVVVHKIIRSCDWKERPKLKEFFC